jgi:hypothetical protein
MLAWTLTSSGLGSLSLQHRGGSVMKHTTIGVCAGQPVRYYWVVRAGWAWAFMGPHGQRSTASDPGETLSRASLEPGAGRTY